MTQYFKWLISPTLFFSDIYKAKATNEKERGIRVERLNKIYARISLTILIGILLCEIFYVIRIPTIIVYLSTIIAFSRCNEIFMAFFKDAFDKLNSKIRRKNGLEYFQRVRLALRSYMELIIDYSILYYMMSKYSILFGIKSMFFNVEIQDILTSVYISVITAMTVGYGEYHPVHPIARLMVIYQIITATLLLVVSFTIYVNLELE